MKRREFIGLIGGAAAWPLAPRAQRSDKVFRVGSLYMADAFRRFGFDQAFMSGMHELGYVEGQNIVYDTRHAAGDRTRLPALVDELILLKPDVLATGEPIVPVVLSKTSTIPIVMFYSSDPVAVG
jgi:putative ABC transport system substrate-binding protein